MPGLTGPRHERGRAARLALRRDGAGAAWARRRPLSAFESYAASSRLARFHRVLWKGCIVSAVVTPSARIS